MLPRLLPIVRSMIRVQAWLCVTCIGLAGCYRQHEETRQYPTTGPSVRGLTPKPNLPRLSLTSPYETDGEVELGPRGTAPDRVSPSPTRRVRTAPGLKVALLGDQGVGDNARAVLQLIADEQADAVIHLGDLSYGATPEAWNAQVDAVLGPDYPYFAAIGNHDIPSWFAPGGFAQRLGARLTRIAGAHCQGEYAINASCTYRGLHFVLSGIGTYGRDHESFLRDALDRSDALHNLCIWHKNQRDMQVGGKTDEVGWAAYQICARHGAPIITGHEHSYARTYTLTEPGNRADNHGATGLADELRLGPGRTFVAVSGLGGQSTRAWLSDHKSDGWWASIYAGSYQLMNGVVLGTDPDIHFGALFITFGVDGDPARARAYFKTTDGRVADEFSWRTAP